MPLENIRAGGPQFAGSWLFPVMPASPETFHRFAKYGVIRLERRLNWALKFANERRLMRRFQLTEVLIPVEPVVSRKPNRFVLSVRTL